mmetsp:Transcript_8570/g.11792  ORF Transcript_8570/g.11792 Transcript_8570/m.11792 type:complete len:157 (-) Transcript_8570:279-749(-)
MALCLRFDSISQARESKIIVYSSAEIFTSRGGTVADLLEEIGNVLRNHSRKLTPKGEKAVLRKLNVENKDGKTKIPKKSLSDILCDEKMCEERFECESIPPNQFTIISHNLLKQDVESLAQEFESMIAGTTWQENVTRYILLLAALFMLANALVVQ